MQITIERLVAWQEDILLRDEPDGHNSLILKRLQLDVLLHDEPFPEGVPVRLPQPDASYSACTVVRWPQSWHFLQPGAELIIAATDWPRVREQIQNLMIS